MVNTPVTIIAQNVDIILSRAKITNMTNIPSEIYQAGAIAIIFLFAIKEFFSWLKNRNGSGKRTQLETELAGINNKLNNHLTAVNKEITEIKEDLREVKNDILNIKISLKK